MFKGAMVLVKEGNWTPLELFGSCGNVVFAHFVLELLSVVENIS
jgi:hypothetical protein